MKVIAVFFIVFIIGNAYSVAVRKNSTNSTVEVRKNATNSTVEVSKSSPSPTVEVSKNSPSPVDGDVVSPGVTVSKGFKKANCLVSRFGVLCAASTDGCVTKNAKTKCGKQCICGTSECSCGTSNCSCQVNAGVSGCRCNGPESKN